MSAGTSVKAGKLFSCTGYLILMGFFGKTTQSDVSDEKMTYKSKDIIQDQKQYKNLTDFLDLTQPIILSQRVSKQLLQTVNNRAQRWGLHLMLAFGTDIQRFTAFECTGSFSQLFNNHRPILHECLILFKSLYAYDHPLKLCTMTSMSLFLIVSASSDPIHIYLNLFPHRVHLLTLTHIRTKFESNTMFKTN